jgi:hypothetical protein
MNDDVGGYYIRNTIARNIEMLYMKVNRYEDYENDGEGQDKFLSNQEHIMKLSDDKYKEKMLKKIVSLVEI